MTLIIYFANVLLKGEDRSLFMPGELTGGHYQITIKCDSCHTGPFADRDAMQRACVKCHGDQRKKPFDSHPRAKFTDPRNADRLENIDALYCVTCHVEHKSEITQVTGLTQPKDFCTYCHADIAKDRPSHKGMSFNTCADAGCHNFHNNRSLYTDFLVKHINEPELLEHRLMPKREFISVIDEVTTYPRDRYPVRKLKKGDEDMPANMRVAENVIHEWSTTAHAVSGVNCSACHMEKQGEKPVWINTPNYQACKQCHDVEVKHFMQGKHGMRLGVGLPPMVPEDARLPMKKDSFGRKLGCGSCHEEHSYSLKKSLVDACLECHDDKHTLAYKQSPHFKVWMKELSGDLPEGSGVTCATCHMPRMPVDVSEWLRRTVVQHNQNATLKPNDKMIRPVCMKCHGLAFTIDALSDRDLVDKNFAGKPGAHVKSIDMAEKDNKRHLEEAGREVR